MSSATGRQCATILRRTLARIALQASNHLLAGLAFCFAEEWTTREIHGEALVPYDVHVSRLDLTTLHVDTAFHRARPDRCYIGVDVHASTHYLLVALAYDDFFEVEVYDNRTHTWVSFDCSDLTYVSLKDVTWGRSQDYLQCYVTPDGRWYETPLDWTTHRVRWEPVPV